MDLNDVPVLGKLNSTVNSIVLNFIFLGIVSVLLGLAILIFPKVLEVFVSVLLILSGMIFFNIAWHIKAYRKKYMGWMDMVE